MVMKMGLDGGRHEVSSIGHSDSKLLGFGIGTEKVGVSQMDAIWRFFRITAE